MICVKPGLIVLIVAKLIATLRACLIPGPCGSDGAMFVICCESYMYVRWFA